ncbi:MAG: Ppx/GppA phosphatase family protein [Acidimicrobiia bacterium]
MRIAAWDLGSNSFHLVVAEAAEDGSFVPLLKEKEMLGLGSVVEEHHGIIPDEHIDRAVATARHFRRIADAAGAQEHVACATAALRRAENADTLIEAVRATTGVHVHVISGRREAELVFTAICSGVFINPGPALCFDLGGGSLEVIVGDQAGMQYAASLPIGVAATSTRVLVGDDVDADQRSAFRALYRNALAPIANATAGLSPRMAIGTAGTISALTKLTLLHLREPIPRSLNHQVLRREDFLELHQSLVRLNREERLALDGLDDRRVDTIVAGSFCLEAIFKLFDLPEIVMSDWGLREGILIDAIGRHDPADWSGDPRSIRRASVQAFARRCSWPEAHSRRVAVLATQIFDGTQELHGLDSRARELLEYSAWLHDIGEHVASEHHDQHSAYLIHHGRLRGFMPDEILLLSATARWHKSGNVRKRDPLVGALSSETQEVARQLCAILRIADGLDRGRAQAISDVRITVDPKTVTIACDAHADPELELWGARRKRALAESLWKRRVRFDVLIKDS